VDVNVTSLQERVKVEAKSYLEQLLSEGARKLLQAAIENEVAEYLQSQSGRRSELENAVWYVTVTCQKEIWSLE
jgi:hypothetical protein